MLMDEMLKISLSTLERLFLVRNNKFVLTDGTGDPDDSCLEDVTDDIAKYQFEHSSEWD